VCSVRAQCSACVCECGAVVRCVQVKEIKRKELARASSAVCGSSGVRRCAVRKAAGSWCGENAREVRGGAAQA